MAQGRKRFKEAAAFVLNVIEEDKESCLCKEPTGQNSLPVTNHNETENVPDMGQSSTAGIKPKVSTDQRMKNHRCPQCGQVTLSGELSYFYADVCIVKPRNGR